MVQVLVYDFVAVGLPYEDATTWLPFGASAVFAAAVAIAFQSPDAAVGLEAATVRRLRDTVVLHLRWVENPFRNWFDYFEGELQLAPLLSARSHLSVSASYELVDSSELTSAERLRAHREIEIRMRDVLGAVALQLERGTQAPGGGAGVGGSLAGRQSG